MTSIRSSMDLPIIPALSRAQLHASLGEEGAGTNFAAILSQAGQNTSADQFTAHWTPNQERSLRFAIAHVFNAFGFFSAGELEQQNRVHGRSIELYGSKSGADDQGHTSLCVTPAETITEHGLEGPNWLAPQEGAHRKADQNKSQLVVHNKVVKGQAQPPACSDPFLPANENRLANEPGFPEHFGTAPTIIQEQIAGRRDRITFKIAEYTVELIARFQNLSEEEKQHLFDEIDWLLEAHGLSFVSATINGVPLTPNLRGRIS